MIQLLEQPLGLHSSSNELRCPRAHRKTISLILEFVSIFRAQSCSNGGCVVEISICPHDIVLSLRLNRLRDNIGTVNTSVIVTVPQCRLVTIPYHSEATDSNLSRSSDASASDAPSMLFMFRRLLVYDLTTFSSTVSRKYGKYANEC